MQRRWEVASLGPDWRRLVGDEVWKILPRTWLPRYDVDARDQLDQLLSRSLDAMTAGGRLSLAECGRDAVIGLRRIPVEELEDRGDLRYGSENLAEFMRRTGRDLVPIVIGRKGGSPWVMDGHHRMRAYALVGRPALALTTHLCLGSGAIRLGPLGEEVLIEDGQHQGERTP